MQISRHWRMNANRYRLEGVRYENGQVSLQDRPMVQTTKSKEGEPGNTSAQQQAEGPEGTAILNYLVNSGDPTQTAAD